ncbi:MAG TPA: ABC transporter ATP-binding protein [Sphaerochaeta sp.]|jgi:ABC-2 type transport system ATP-binding protein|uniref:ABC transporter ATP-binding protein n=1 Tax=unclassified Sphaerochaeta TaxID=2637943 RepID=UPI000E94F778|nr:MULTISPECIES: ABC transporter ATP-binding protein [unclassified Sphaerochaeta]MCK9598761.1 ABC transporter ATP-binding protein [Sphaerochaeta sp.]MDX9824730.1 ABC transporter ATP-binding protein [Sphaerochaeta sp.]HAP56963.1 ABC transporter ATP-binding protein [Sphaerochaeta sp.]HBO36070.1 ABC transporter ATP-binding protein [Sphaerochaeta sp.]HPE93373.1 ABC transporter ATP-binding protein [Sphaerochaeta sp.]
MLECKNLYKRYGNQKKNAVDNLSLCVESGQIFGFLGPNGAGKSTTIKMLVGLLKPDQGTILFDGKNSGSDALAYKQDIGYVPDEPVFYERMTALEHLAFIADIYEIDRHERKNRIDELAKRLLLSDVLSDQISSYSHGMKQKLSVIAALLPSPKLLILDEPMVGLDPKASFILKQLLKEYAKAGNTVFFSTHVLEVAQQLCDTLGIIKEGKLLYSGSFEQLQANKGEGTENLEQLFLELTEEGTPS